jgi:D-alanyl-D-alanine-carboxypeptidase/D-alanyl-D-alanine-endopeptidase
VLGQALAYHAGTTYPKLIRARVLDPLGMTETTFAMMPAWDFPPFGAGHDLGGAPVAAWHFDSMLPAGGIRSSLSDMLKYLRCNLGEGPLAKECLFAQQSRADGAPGHGIGLVWWTNTANGAISHGGDTKGFHAQIAISKDHQTGVVVMSNGPVVTDIAAHVLLPSYPIAVCHAVPAAADASPYAGAYCNASGGFLFQVASGKNAGELSIAVLPQDALTYTLVKPETYAAASVGAAVTFVKENGAVVGMRFAQNGEDFPVLRLDVQGKALVTALPSQFPPVVSLDAATLKQYVGTYTAKDLTFTVTLNDDQLYVRLTGQSAIPVYPSAKDEFFCKVVDAQVSFARDASGNVTALTLHQNGHDLAAPRTKAAPI